MNAEGGNDTLTFLAEPFTATYYVEGGDGDDVLTNLDSDPATFIGGDGDDVLTGGSGNDGLYGQEATDFADEGDDELYGGGGSDLLLGSEGDDVLRGDGGNDTLIGQGGRDDMRGGDGADTMLSSYIHVPSDGVLGPLLCGDDGDDTIVANGPGHQCVDGGADQASSGPTNYDCQYSNVPAGTSDDWDVGTTRRCANPAHTNASGDLLPSNSPCGCDP